MKENGNAEPLVATQQNTRRRNRQARKTEQTFIKPETYDRFHKGHMKPAPQPLKLYLSYSLYYYPPIHATLRKGLAKCWTTDESGFGSRQGREILRNVQTGSETTPRFISTGYGEFLHRR